MTDIPAIKVRLSDPREVAALLGLRVEQKQRNGVRVRCPVHNGKTPSLAIWNESGIIATWCFACQVGGDVIDLIVALEGDFKAGLARAEQLAGGSSGRVYVPEPDVPRLDPEVYHDLAERILDAGKLDGRPWVREVEEYLARRRLLELARADGWACLPGLRWLIQIAEEVCNGTNSAERSPNRVDRGGNKALEVGSNGRGQPYSTVSQGNGQLVRSTSDLLVRADLARYNQRGEFVSTWGRWRLVIPWRGPDGQITSLQRRRTWAHDGDGPEPAKYVFPRGIRPEWPYGSDRLCIGQDRKEIGYGVFSGGVERLRNDARGPTAGAQRTAASGHVGVDALSHSRALCPTSLVAIVEGAVDVLAMRALHPTFTTLGLPGIGGWRADWAKLVAGANLRICLDRGKPDPHGVIPEDMASARIALDCAGRGLETERVLQWLTSRHRRGRALFCVLCGREEAWLCRGCGRRRAPEGMDWGAMWEKSVF